MLVPLSTALWPLVEVGGNKVLFGIDAARRAIWRRDRNLYEAGLKAGEEKGYQSGYQSGYDARAAEEMRQNGGNGRTRQRRRRILRDDQ